MFNLISLSDRISSPYTAIRQSIFGIIYPAPTIVNRGTKNFIGIHQLTNSMSNYDQFCHNLQYDFSANMDLIKPKTPIAKDHFEAMLIAEINNNQVYNRKIKYLIYLGGNTGCYQVLIPEMISIYKQHNKKAFLISFNPPGVGLSPGQTSEPETYYNALKSVIENLHNNDIPYSNIMIMGHSLGGGIAAHVVAEYQAVGNNISLFVDRSMISLSEAAAVKIRSGIPTLLLRYTLGNLLYLLTKLIIKILKLELNVAKDFVAINNAQPGAAHGMMAHDDEMMVDCCLSNGLVHPTPFFAHFKLRSEEAHRKSHSKVRSELIAADGENTADHFLHAVITRFINKQL